jgi:hypothetical protein
MAQTARPPAHKKQQIKVMLHVLRQGSGLRIDARNLPNQRRKHTHAAYCLLHSLYYLQVQHMQTISTHNH